MGEAIETGGRLGSGHLPLAEDRSDTTGRRDWLLCRSGVYLIALPLNCVIEIMRVLPVSAISGMPRYVRGLSIIRGVPVPIVDAGCLLSEQTTLPERLVTMTTGTRMVALAVESVLGVYAAGREKLGQLPPLLRDAAAETIAAIGTMDAELLLCLRSAHLIPEDVLARLNAEGISS